MKMAHKSMYGNFISLLTLRRSAQFLRSSAQFLGSSGKQWEAALSTFLLTINELGKSREKRKKSARKALSGK
jgi:hypothetical protein